MEKRLARREKSRVLWIDGVRFLAFGVVFTRHYFESFFPENIPEVRGGISAFLWRGITGKAAVSMFVCCWDILWQHRLKSMRFQNIRFEDISIL